MTSRRRFSPGCTACAPTTLIAHSPRNLLNAQTFQKPQPHGFAVVVLQTRQCDMDRCLDIVPATERLGECEST